jgi:hypothetical protein
MSRLPTWVLMLGTFVLIVLAVVILHPWSGIGVN